MAKAKNTAVFFCQECGYESVKWMGQCPGCKTWNSFVEEKMSIRSKRNGVPVRAGAVGPVRTGAIGSGRAGEASRLSLHDALPISWTTGKESVREWKNWTECWEAGSFLVP